MGFMDKAKKLAEQAQEKLDEAQAQFNQNAAPGQPQEQSQGVQYDQHGRPVAGEPAPPAAATPPPEAAPPEPPEATAPPASEPAAPAEEAPDAPATAPPSTGGANANPDPFKPLGQ